ncbi:ATP-binding protein [Oceanospirillum sediminis]|uniref:ATP-binding protein n=1 Tax=Oceanospirillum sediminis TaxID=2760088 RepID=A0A839IMQ9_9GAMM|nr:ATP-binding protein [Oceanospirillum sediminis]MBB1485789.1 ATP-binding protein [Oceanospirillum sediminis]
MTDRLFLHKALAQDVAISKIKKSLITENKRCIVIQGPSGSGKTWLAEAISQDLFESSPVFAVGDLVRISESYAPFERLTRRKKGLKI